VVVSKKGLKMPKETQKLSNRQKEAPFVFALQAELMYEGFVVAVPQPDLRGGDLWFAREEDSFIYRAQAKSSWTPVTFKKSPREQYLFLIPFDLFRIALHQPYFAYFFGIPDKNRRFHRACIPAKQFRGKYFRVYKYAQTRFAIGLSLVKDDEKYTLCSGSLQSKFPIYAGKDVLPFYVEEVSSYFTSDLPTSLQGVLKESDRNGLSCDLKYEKLPVPFKAIRGACVYTRKAVCLRARKIIAGDSAIPEQAC